MSGRYFWYWSISLLKIAKANLLRSMALCSSSTSRFAKRLRELLWATATRAIKRNRSRRPSSSENDHSHDIHTERSIAEDLDLYLVQKTWQTV